MPIVKKVTIVPNLPERLSPLLKIAYNLWWTWTPEAIYLFHDMDRDLWERCNHNPVALLGSIEQRRLDELERDEIFISRMEDIERELDRYLQAKTWCQQVSGDSPHGTIAYFSAEFGLHESLPLYSGGLGILAGDHMKSASDLGLPLSGVGLLYKHGYFKQQLTPDGWQLETYPSNDFYNMPLTQVKDESGQQLMIKVEFPGRDVYAAVWSINVGRIKIYMLDTDVEQNSPEDRRITSHLYGGDLETRLQQELILGIGGIRALDAMGLTPTVCHMNEGHSAFLAVERVSQLVVKHGLSFNEAFEVVRATNVFTTHTPVPAGIDRFPPDLISRYFGRMVAAMGIDMGQFIGLGRIDPSNQSESFCMAVLAIKMASQTNGVSRLHGEVSRKMWAQIWPQIPPHEVPITHITNGIHTLGWLSNEMATLYKRYLGPRWIDEPTNHNVWKRVAEIPAFELWRCRERLRERLISFSRSRLKKQLREKGAHGWQVKYADEVLDPECLTIGFARRFATYKRANLIFHDIDRLKALLNDPERPVQLIFAGKAHPKDKEGKELIHQVVKHAHDPELRNRIVFIENYDIEVARHLVQGVDVWLNTPRRPLEASGTSGMKVVANGGLNLSIMDGWWDEAFNGENGWAIGSGEEYQDHAYQDEVESQLLYDILENTVIPLFYSRSSHNIPLAWVEMIKKSIMTLCPVFNTNRMVEEYANSFYLPNLMQWNVLSSDSWKEATELVHWKERVSSVWGDVRIVSVDIPLEQPPKVGDRLPIKVGVHLGHLDPKEVRVEAYIGHLDINGEIVEGHPLPLLYTKESDGPVHYFSGKLFCLSSGRIGFTIRCYPFKKELAHKFDMGLLTWWEN